MHVVRHAGGQAGALLDVHARLLPVQTGEIGGQDDLLAGQVDHARYAQAHAQAGGIAVAAQGLDALAATGEQFGVGLGRGEGKNAVGIGLAVHAGRYHRAGGHVHHDADDLHRFASQSEHLAGAAAGMDAVGRGLHQARLLQADDELGQGGRADAGLAAEVGARAGADAPHGLQHYARVHPPKRGRHGPGPLPIRSKRHIFLHDAKIPSGLPGGKSTIRRTGKLNKPMNTEKSSTERANKVAADRVPLPGRRGLESGAEGVGERAERQAEARGELPAVVRSARLWTSD